MKQYDGAKYTVKYPLIDYRNVTFYQTFSFLFSNFLLPSYKIAINHKTKSLSMWVLAKSDTH